jgi:hypothetical protein
MSPSRPLLQELVFRAIGLPLPPPQQPQKPVERANLAKDLPNQTWLTENGLKPLSPLSARFVDPPQRLLSVEDIRRWLLRFRHDPTFQEDGHRVPYTMLAKSAGLNRDTLHELLRTRRVALLTRKKLTSAIEAIEAGRLRFIQDKRTQKWSWESDGPPLRLHESGERREKPCWSSRRKMALMRCSEQRRRKRAAGQHASRRRALLDDGCG